MGDVKLSDITDNIYIDSSNKQQYDYETISMKDANNKPSTNFYDSINNIDLFMSMSNVMGMYKKIEYLRHANYNEIMPDNYNVKDFTASDCLGLMKKWVMDNYSDDIEFLDTSAALSYLNNTFINDNKNVYETNTNITDINVFRSNYNITYPNGIVSKKPKDMLACDISGLNLHKSETIYIDSSKHRYNNKIPFWQSSMNTRNYDKTNEGLHCINSEDASLETQVRGYDMSVILGNLNHVKNE